jgi:hypothetical protein
MTKAPKQIAMGASLQAGAFFMTPESKPPAKTVALLFIHGIGQQAPYTSLSELCKALHQHQPPGVTLGGPEPGFVFDADNNKHYARMRFQVREQGQVVQNLDVFEAYWAPITEGQVGALASVKFMLSKGLQAAWTALRGTFRRHVFNQEHRFDLGSTWLSLLLAYLAVMALLFVVWVLPAWYLGLHALNLGGKLAQGMGFLDAWVQTVDQVYPHAGKLAPLMPFVFLLLAVLGRFMAGFIRQFVGDVVVYVNAYSADKFADARERIQKRCLELAQFICAEGCSYDKMVFAGHSLGSVIVYDTINRLMLDALAKDASHVEKMVARSRLITWGSPLDKVAYVFWTAGQKEGLRDLLAQNRQPLISIPALRRFRWINVWNSRDPVSSTLDFFDRPGEKTTSPTDHLPVQDVRQQGGGYFVSHNNYLRGRKAQAPQYLWQLVRD